MGWNCVIECVHSWSADRQAAILHNALFNREKISRWTNERAITIESAYIIVIRNAKQQNTNKKYMPPAHTYPNAYERQVRIILCNSSSTALTMQTAAGLCMHHHRLLVCH